MYKIIIYDISKNYYLRYLIPIYSIIIIIIQLCYNQNISYNKRASSSMCLEVDGGDVGESLHGAAPPPLLQPRPRMPPPPQGLCTQRVVTCHHVL